MKNNSGIPFRATMSKGLFWAYLPPPATSSACPPLLSPPFLRLRMMIKGSLSPLYCPFSTPLSRQITSAHLITSLSLSL